MNTETQNQITDRQNNEARQFAIAQLQSVMDAEKAKRAANIRAHSASEASKLDEDGMLDDKFTQL